MLPLPSLFLQSFILFGFAVCSNNFKTHGHDVISIPMLKLCGPSLCKPLSVIFKSCLSQIKFPMEWKKVNVVPIQKKKVINSASKTTDLSLCFRSACKIFERLLFNEIKKFFNENDLLSSNQSGFRPGNSWKNQLLSITHEL